jgi:hypothetical protein
MAYSFPLLERIMRRANASLTASFPVKAASYAAFSGNFRESLEPERTPMRLLFQNPASR